MSHQYSTKQLAIRLKAVCLALARIFQKFGLVCVLNVCVVHEALAQWTERTSSGSRNWSSIASSNNGAKLAAAVNDGYVYTSTDSGVTWTERTAAGSEYWVSIASSSDGANLAAVWTGEAEGGYLHYSEDSGASWVTLYGPNEVGRY